MEVTAHGLVLHTLTANQFVDSLEYDRVMSGQGRSETFQVNNWRLPSNNLLKSLQDKNNSGTIIASLQDDLMH